MNLRELLTEVDNVTLEPAYVWWAVIIVVGLALEVFAVIQGRHFDYQSYGLGSGALMAGAGWGKKLGS